MYSYEEFRRLSCWKTKCGFPCVFEVLIWWGNENYWREESRWVRERLLMKSGKFFESSRCFSGNNNSNTNNNKNNNNSKDDYWAQIVSCWSVLVEPVPEDRFRSCRPQRDADTAKKWRDITLTSQTNDEQCFIWTGNGLKQLSDSRTIDRTGTFESSMLAIAVEIARDWCSWRDQLWEKYFQTSSCFVSRTHSHSLNKRRLCHRLIKIHKDVPRSGEMHLSHG